MMHPKEEARSRREVEAESVPSRELSGLPSLLDEVQGGLERISERVEISRDLARIVWGRKRRQDEPQEPPRVLLGDRRDRHLPDRPRDPIDADLGRVGVKTDLEIAAEPVLIGFDSEPEVGPASERIDEDEMSLP